MCLSAKNFYTYCFNYYSLCISSGYTFHCSGGFDLYFSLVLLLECILSPKDM